MKTSISYDWAAGFYDQSRDFPEAVATHGIQAILDTAGPSAHILDVGTGTGRFSVPLIQRGADLIGCDLSMKMMARLREKYTAARLVQADAACLPFAPHSFDALTTSHVMHLIGPWREALREFFRVLKPNGVYINVSTERKGKPAQNRIHQFWESRITAYGYSSQRPGVQDEKEMLEELLRMGAKLEKIEAVHFTRTHTLRDVIERIAGRTYSYTVNIPENVFTASLRDLRAWSGRELGNLDTPIEEDACFILNVAHFEV